MQLAGLDPLRMDFGGPIGALNAAGAFLGKGVSDIFDPLNVFHKGEDQRSAEAQAAAEKAKAEAEARKQQQIAAMVFCPTGQKPNPAFTSIPVEARTAATAAGIQQCIPDEQAAKPGEKDLKACYFQAGSRKFPCDADGFSRAVAHAHAMAKQGGMPRFVLHVQGGTISLKRCIVPVARPGTTPPGPAPGTVPAAPMLPPGTPGGWLATAQAGPGGAFSCPSGMSIYLDANGRVVCAPAGLAPPPGAAPPPPAPSSAPARSRRGRAGRATGRRGRHLRGLGEAGDLQERTRALQVLLQQIHARAANGQVPAVTGVIDAPTVQAVNHFLAHEHRPPIAAGDLLLDLGTNNALYQRIAAWAAPQQLNGPGCGCAPSGMQGLGQSQASQVQQSMRHYGGPALPGWLYQQHIPRARFVKHPVVQPNLATGQCPQGYFPTQQGCVRTSVFASGSGYPHPSPSQQVAAALSPYDLSPRVPPWMVRQQVPPGGSVRASWG